jgi:hypothetical protein
MADGAPLSFHKVLALPGALEADAWYLVKEGAQVRMVITSATGEPVELKAAAPRYYEVFAPAAEWTVNHNLGAVPAAVKLLTMGGVEFDAAIVHVSDNQFVVSVAPPTGGQVIVQ